MRTSCLLAVLLSSALVSCAMPEREPVETSRTIRVATFPAREDGPFEPYVPEEDPVPPGLPSVATSSPSASATT